MSRVTAQSIIDNTPTKKGILKMSKKYEANLRKSKDEDYIKLADMNNKEVDFFYIPGPAIDSSYTSVYIPEADMTLPSTMIKAV